MQQLNKSNPTVSDMKAIHLFFMSKHLACTVGRGMISDSEWVRLPYALVGIVM